MKRLYIAGPMSGLPDLNFPAFNAEAARLRALGYDIVNPAEINVGTPHPGWAACMKLDIKQLVDCDGVALLPDWFRSKGASIEHRLAHDLGMPIYHAAAIVSSVLPTPVNMAGPTAPAARTTDWAAA